MLYYILLIQFLFDNITNIDHILRTLSYSVSLYALNTASSQCYCYHSIGVRSNRYPQDLQRLGGLWIYDDDDSSVDEFESSNCECQSWCAGHGEEDCWFYEEIFTIKLDCNLWTVSYYNGDSLIKSEGITPNLSYQFCGQFCMKPNWTHFKIVETPHI